MKPEFKLQPEICILIPAKSPCQSKSSYAVIITTLFSYGLLIEPIYLAPSILSPELNLDIVFDPYLFETLILNPTTASYVLKSTLSSTSSLIDL